MHIYNQIVKMLTNNRKQCKSADMFSLSVILYLITAKHCEKQPTTTNEMQYYGKCNIME